MFYDETIWPEGAELRDGILQLIMATNSNAQVNDLCDQFAINFCTYNMHGFNSGSVFLKHLCLDNDIILYKNIGFFILIYINLVI